MQEADPRHLLVNVVKILKQLEIPYLITGGMAVFVWGRPRFTADIDIVIELELMQINKLAKSLRMLGEHSYIDEHAMKEALSINGEFNFIDGVSGVKVDFWSLDKRDLFEISRLKRKKVKKILNENVSFISPEDLILSKLKWYNESRSTRHLEDIESIFKISSNKLDMKYLKNWATKMKVENILNKIINKIE